MLRVGAVRGIDDRVRDVDAERLLAACFARAQHVQRHARDDGREPAAQVLDLVRVRATQPQPGLLNRVVGFAQRAKHPVGDRAQMGPLLLEAFAQPFPLVLPSHPSRQVGHTTMTPESEVMRQAIRPVFSSAL